MVVELFACKSRNAQTSDLNTQVAVIHAIKA
jgi:hypothetical protein